MGEKAMGVRAKNGETGRKGKERRQILSETGTKKGDTRGAGVSRGRATRRARDRKQGDWPLWGATITWADNALDKAGPELQAVL